MIKALLVLWIISAVLIIREQRFVRMIICISVFSLLSSLCFFMFAAPDVAMAEAVVTVFSTIIYIISFEKYYSSHTKRDSEGRKKTPVINYIFPLLFCLALLCLFVMFIPGNTSNSILKNRYMSSFSRDIGGINAVTAIYLGYRMYDTLFEALMLLVSISAIIHLSWYTDFFGSQEKYFGIQHSRIAVATIRIICPVLLLFGFYIMLNGHVSPGGGFQGGVILASFFICRYMISDIYDIPVGKAVKLEKIIYIGIVILGMLFIFFAAEINVPVIKTVYLILINLFIGMKVACGFFVIFYRFIAFERR